MSFYVISPLPITDTIFTGSNVPENDYQEFSSGTAYAVGDDVMVATSTANIHKTFQDLVAQSAGLTADILDEDCSDISDWTDNDTGVGGGVSEVSPTGQFRFDTNISAAGNYYARRGRTLSSPPNTFTIEIKTYFDSLGTMAAGDNASMLYTSATWKFWVVFASDGLYILKASAATTEVGTNIVKCNASAAWQTWRFEVTKTVEADATVTVYLKEETGDFVSQGTVDCDDVAAAIDGSFTYQQGGNTTNNMVSHIDYIKIATGLGRIANTSDYPVNNSSWLETGSTNRWNCFNNVLGSQTEQATKIEYVLTPGAVIDSVALLNIESDTVDIVEIDSADQLIANNDWTDATGGTPPTGWTEVGTVPDFTIQGAALRITCDANGEGISQTIAVSAATEYQLVFLYKNTASDIAQVAVYDMTHSANILATTDLTSSVANSSYSYVFTTPAGCVSIKISFLAKTAGDIVYFEAPYLCPTEYSETVTTGASKTSVVKSDIPQKAAGILTVTINKSGTAAIGELIIGTKTTLGTMRPKPQIGFRNLSTLDEDVFGNIDITRRGYKNKMVCGVIVPSASLNSIHKFLCDHKDDMMVYVGSETYSCLQLYGFSKEPQIIPEVDKTNSDMNLEIWSVI
jgi:hypothetical protein